MKFDNSFQTLPKFFFEEVVPTPLTSPKLIHVTNLKSELGLPELSDENLLLWLNSEMRIPEDQRISTRYAGHQFGVWAGQLGDGRAISLGELITKDHKRLEIQTKGSGLTPFSRMGDGKAVIRSSVREYLCSIAMKGLNIPTTDVLALITGEDPVYREEVEKSAIVARVFPSNLRFGHFEIAYHYKKIDELQKLIDYSRKYFFENSSVEEMLETIIDRTAKLMAHWQSVGFCHGVMNTDNMSLLGLTIDYGPYGFLEDTKLDHICNHSDHQGRYAYDQQPQVAMWNLEKLFICFIDQVSKEKLSEMLNRFPETFQNYYLQMSRHKLGLEKNLESDWELFVNLLKTISALSIDYTYFFRQLSHYQKDKPESILELLNYYGKSTELLHWLKIYDERLGKEELNEHTRQQKMQLVNPKFILRNYIAQEIIADVENAGSTKLHEWINILQSPYQDHHSYHEYSLPTPPSKKNYIVSCSS